MQCVRQIFHVVRTKSQHYNKARRLVCRFKHNSNSELEQDANEQEKNLYMEMARDYLGVGITGHRVFVLQPYIKWGHDKRRNTTPQLQLAEAVALVNTLPGWQVVNKKCIPLLTLQKKQLFGTGKLETLQNDIQQCGNVTALFISTNLLRFVQISELQQIFNLPIYDRYTIVIHIFRLHAKTVEAKLQVSLAEIPYMRKKMYELAGNQVGRINLEERRKLILEKREKKLKNALQNLREHRRIIRQQRQKFGLPSIAVVGYTNAGKTSLIKALTGDVSLMPRDKLFATLDTTVHEGILLNKLKVLYIDTIGFIQDVPETLIEPFKVTLEDAMIADIIIHVYDASHPDVEAQIQHVQETITPMIEANKVIINVANKCDIAEPGSVPADTLAISAINLTGIDLLRIQVEEKLLQASGLKRKRFRVEAGSTASSWLYNQATVTNAEPDEKDSQFLFLDVIITPTAFYKFKRFLRE